MALRHGSFLKDWFSRPFLPSFASGKSLWSRDCEQKSYRVGSSELTCWMTLEEALDDLDVAGDLLPVAHHGRVRRLPRWEALEVSNP